MLFESAGCRGCFMIMVFASVGSLGAYDRWWQWRGKSYMKERESEKLLLLLLLLLLLYTQTHTPPTLFISNLQFLRIYTLSHTSSFAVFFLCLLSPHTTLGFLGFLFPFFCFHFSSFLVSFFFR